METPGTLESRMQANLHVRFGGGPLEKGSGNGLPRWWPTQPLKRAAVKFGIGRYLYRQKPQWVDYDPQKRQFVRPPTLAGLTQEVITEKKAKAKEAREPAKAAPANGQEFHRRLQEYDAKLAKDGLCKPGDLVKHIATAGKKAGFDPDMTTWTEKAIQVAREETKAFESSRKQAAQKQAA
jgi:hypothetical protein